MSRPGHASRGSEAAAATFGRDIDDHGVFFTGPRTSTDEGVYFIGHLRSRIRRMRRLMISPKLLALPWQRIRPMWYRIQRRLRWRRRIYSTAAVDLPSTSARWHRGIDVSNARATSSAVQRLP